MAKYQSKHEILEELVRQAWMLSEDEIASIQPGSIATLKHLVETRNEIDEVFHHGIDLEKDPAVHFLKMMRKPEFFPFTCRHLLSLNGDEPFTLLPFQQIALQELWTRQFPMFIATRGGSKTLLLGLLIALKCLLQQGSKIVVTGAGFRQSRLVFEYVERFWYKSPIYRDLVSQFNPSGRENGPRRGTDRFEFVVGDSVATFIPIGDGGAIRGLRSNCTISDEFQSINQDIYETVIQGFGAVTLDPVQNVMDAAGKNVLKQLGLWSTGMDDHDRSIRRGNQSIISGTAYYSFNHFYSYYQNYKNIIESKGDKDRLEEIFNGPPPDGFDWRDFSIIRLPYRLLPKGFMDDKTVARAKQLNNTSIFLMEYETIFAQDSDGFFRRGLIERCVVGKKDDKDPVKFPSCPEGVEFYATINGNFGRKCIMGVDPASERDKFAIVIIELWEDHRRIVYAWTTKKNVYKERLKRGMTQENNFYAYCARKIRDLQKSFNCDKILIDAGAGGGGNAILEALRDKDKIKGKELPIYETISDDIKDEKETDNMEGLHIVEMVNFRDNSWVSEANHGMKKDFEDRILLFPKVDALAMAEANLDDVDKGRILLDEDQEVIQIYDTLEDVIFEIEELKDELATIIVTSSATGLERWDTPNTKGPGSKKGALRKDRYAALLMANMAARKLFLAFEVEEDYQAVGGFAHLNTKKDKKTEEGYVQQKMYRAPAWFNNNMPHPSVYGGMVTRRG